MDAATAYTDLHSLASLRHEITADGGAGQVREVAGQFAAVFTHMMLKSMRDASLGEGIFDSDQSLFYRDLFDQQLALSLSEAGGVGIADLVEEQLGHIAGGSQAPAAGRALAAYENVRAFVEPDSSLKDRERAADTESSRSNNWSGQRSR